MSTHNWPMVPLGELLARNQRTVSLVLDQLYQEVTIRLWGKGVVQRGAVHGGDIAAERRFEVSTGQFIVSRIDARNGAMGIVPPELDKAIVTNDFPSFDVNRERMIPEFLGWLCKTEGFVEMCQTTSEGTTNRVRLKENEFLRLAIPLPPLEEQRRIVARIDRLTAKIDEADSLSDDCERYTKGLLAATHHQISNGAPRRRLGDVAPLIRRPAEVAVDAEYPQVSVRSFGRGTFHNPPLLGSEITWQQPYRVCQGDILVSNIKAWEGAIAVASDEDDGRYGSHRYLTFVPIPNVATAEYLSFYLLSPEGLFQVGEASPGSADRNRTLSSKKMQDIEVPIPPFDQQLRFNDLVRNCRRASTVRQQSKSINRAMLPSILDRAFKGEL